MIRRGRSKTPPKYRKHKASQQAVVTLNSRDYYLGPYDSQASKDAYDRLISEWLANGRRLPSSHEAGLLIAELSADYWDFAEGYYVKNGLATFYQDRIVRTILYDHVQYTSILQR
ncbi:hypothetical protein N9231_05990 [Saprospiraceae bacterium]|nr:hypothetical protein [Saprospiraceae bacterium]